MIKKRLNIVSAATCVVFTVVVLFSAPITAFAADAGSGSSDSVNSEIEPLPYIIIGALVIFAGLVVFDVIFHPYEEKKDDGIKPVHAKTTSETKTQPKPKYSTDYDYLLGMKAAQVTQQMPVKLTKAIPKQ